MKSLQKGFLGENIAVEFLEKKDYQIRERNWRKNHKEIDIIAETKNELVIVEVKTRASNYFQNPEDAVDLKKQKFLIEAAEFYVEENNIDKDVRFDVISILINDNEIKIEHIENAFAPNF